MFADVFEKQLVLNAVSYDNRVPTADDQVGSHRCIIVVEHANEFADVDKNCYSEPKNYKNRSVEFWSMQFQKFFFYVFYKRLKQVLRDLTAYSNINMLETIFAFELMDEPPVPNLCDLEEKWLIFNTTLSRVMNCSNLEFKKKICRFRTSVYILKFQIIQSVWSSLIGL